MGSGPSDKEYCKSMIENHKKTIEFYKTNTSVKIYRAKS